MEKIALSGPGLYIAEHIHTNEQLLISIVGKAPMLRVKNVLSINDFANSNEKNNAKELRENVENDPDVFTYSRFGVIPKEIKEETKLYTSEEYHEWIQMKRDNMLESEIIAKICKCKNVEYAQAKVIWNQICSQQ